MSRRGISEKSVQLINAMPLVKRADVLRLAKLPEYFERVPDTIGSILIEWDGGENHEIVHLKPGARTVQVESVAATFLKLYAEQGLVRVPLDASDEDERRARLAGLVAARRFYQDRGARKLQEYRAIHSLTNEQLEERRESDLWQIHVNQAIADLIEVEMRAASKAKAA
jgi:hypothetical protein